MSVNLPGLVLPRAEDTLRLLHIHRNVPGVLARVNGLLADGGVNVEAQLLGTRGEVGYVVTDSASGTTQAIVDQIRAMPETISLRVIF
jgi:D-3-phosphoglycerate dehydrogenase